MYTVIMVYLTLDFLPVGHTHKDIDTFFGVYSKYLTQMDVYTVEVMCYFSSQFWCDKLLELKLFYPSKKLWLLARMLSHCWFMHWKYFFITVKKERWEAFHL